MGTLKRFCHYFCFVQEFRNYKRNIQRKKSTPTWAEGEMDGKAK